MAKLDTKSRAKSGAEGKNEDKPSRRGDARARMYRELVFESAECVFGRHGFDATTMQDIANEAGVSLKTLYASYSGKQEIYEEIQKVRGKAFIEGVLVAAAMGHTPMEKLVLTVRSHMDFMLSHRDWLRFRLRTRVDWGIRPDDEFAAEYWQQGLDNISGILSAGMEEGTFHEGDPYAVASIVQAIMQVEVTRVVEVADSDGATVAEGIMLHLNRLLCPVK
ncbi:MAG: AcrR family transcriptional regulator [Myxococcota bacterium]